MLERLLGRQELREERDSLEEELQSAEVQLESARQRLEKAEKRRSEAVSEKQEAQRRANVLEERLKSLKVRLEDREQGTEREGSSGFFRTLSVEPRELAERLGSYSSRKEDLVTLASDDLSGEDVLDDLEGDLVPAMRFEGSGVLFHDQGGPVSCVASHPALDLEPSIRYGRRFVTDPIELPRDEHVFCLARADESAFGRVHGGEVSSFGRIVAGVGSRHGKGGFSQGRFERLRDEGVREHVGETAEAVSDLRGEGEFLALGGSEGVARELLAALNEPVAFKPLDISDVEDEDDLLWADSRFWELRVHVL